MQDQNTDDQPRNDPPCVYCGCYPGERDRFDEDDGTLLPQESWCGCGCHASEPHPDE